MAIWMQQQAEALLKQWLESGLESIEPFVSKIDSSLEESFREDPFQFDPESVASALSGLWAINSYFGAELRGWENVPSSEPVLFVGNHSGGLITIDAVPLMLRWYESRGCEKPLYGLAHNILFAIPDVGPRLRRCGCLPASHENAERALDKGESVIVFPGGDYEVFRPWAERNEIHFGGRMGFVELAIRKGIRVIPMTIHGAHESTFVLTRGHRLAMRAGLDRLKVKVFPITWSIPFGLVPAFIPSIPLPSKLTVELGEPLDWSVHSPDQADDPEIVSRCYEEITRRMQESMDRMASEHPNPILTRLGELGPGRFLAALGRQQ
jgi:1-acyl-sn-glycerol-3-phosphate acyltransferase